MVDIKKRLRKWKLENLEEMRKITLRLPWLETHIPREAEERRWDLKWLALDVKRLDDLMKIL